MAGERASRKPPFIYLKYIGTTAQRMWGNVRKKRKIARYPQFPTISVKRRPILEMLNVKFIKV